MTQHAQLNNVDHQNLKIITEKSAAYGNNQSYTPIFPFEFRHAQADYPIFFVKSSDKTGFTAVALQGFEQHENLFLKDGEWDAGYIPLMVEREPFLIGMQDNGAEPPTPTVHIDMASPRISETEGQPLFLSHGGNSEYLNHISAILKTIHDSTEATEKFVSTLTELDLIEAFNLDIQLNNGTKNRLSGFFTINEEKLKALTPEQLGRLNQSGMLYLIYMVLASHEKIAALIKRKDAVTL